MLTESATVAQPKLSSTATKASTNNLSWWLLPGILLLTFIVFFPTLQNDFVNWDDDVNILDNPHVQQLNWESIKGIFSSTVLGNYNPLPILTFSIEHYFVGANPFLFHLNNLLLHLLAVGLVFLLGKKLRLPTKLVGELSSKSSKNSNEATWTGAFVAIIFAIHPMHVESVAWITERKDLLFTVFYLAGLLVYLKARSNTENQSYYLGIVPNKIAILLGIVSAFFILSLLSKIQAVAFPLTLIGLDFLIKNKYPKLPYAKAFYAVLFLMSLTIGLLGIYFLQKSGSINANDFSFFERIFIGAYSLLIYLVKFIFPYEMAAVYPYPSKLTVIHFAALLPFCAYLYLLFWSFQKKHRSLFFSLWFFLVNIIFVLQFLGAGQAYLADRFSYLPYVGLSFGLVYLLIHLFNKYPAYKTTLIGIPILLIGIWSWQSFQQTKVWQNGESLWSQVITHYPESDLAYHNRGYWYQQHGNAEQAILDYNQAIALNPSKAKYFNSRGKHFLNRSEFNLALNDYSQAIQLAPEQAEYYNNRSVAYGAQSLFAPALEDLNKALTLTPDFADAYLNRALLYAHTNAFGAALADNLQYLQWYPDDADIWLEAGMNAQFSGKPSAAKQYFERALRLNPNNAETKAALRSL